MAVKVLFEKRSPAYFPLFIVDIVLGPLLILILSFVFKSTRYDWFYIAFNIISFAIPSMIMTYIITIAVLYFNKKISAFMVGIIGGGSTVLITLFSLLHAEIQIGFYLLSFFINYFLIGFIAAMVCFLISLKLGKKAQRTA